MCLAVSGFMVMGLVSRWSLAKMHLGAAKMQPPSLLVVASKDSGRWLDVCCLLLTFPELFWLVVAY